MATAQTNPSETESRAANAPARRTRRWKLPVFALLVITAIGVSGWLSGLRNVEPTVKQETHIVGRSTLVIKVTDEANIESSRNTEIKCRIRGGYGGRGGASAVTWVIPAGTVVKKGAELVKLDTKVIEETVSLGKTDTNNAKAQLARAKADLANAKVAVEAYLKGRYSSQLKGVTNRKIVAEENLNTSKDLLTQAKDLFRRGYVTELEVEANQFTLNRAELELGVAKTEIDVLKRLTRAKELGSLNAQLEAATARVEGRTAGLKLEQSRLDLAEIELKNCIIRAPQDGLVIYPSIAKWKDAPDVTPGADVHNNQVLLLMPDLSQMQVTIGVHESIVDRITQGVPARVRFSGGQSFDCEVSMVSVVARPAGWWTGNVVKYDTVINLPANEGLKPGMTAEVDVIIAQYEDVLTAPVNAVLDTELGQFCWVKSGSGSLERRKIELGDGNDSFVVVESGLSEGDEVVVDPLTSIAEARELVGATLTHTIGTGTIDITVTEQGALESANNTEIKCKVRGSSTITWLVENGTDVKPGDELIKLENKEIEEFLHERNKYVHLSKDAAIGARAQATRAGLEITEYLEGQYPTELMKLERDLAIAESNLRTSKDILNHRKMKKDLGYASKLSVDQIKTSIQRGQVEVDLKKKEIEVLKKFKKDEELTTLRGDWESAKAEAKGHEEVIKMDEERVRLAEEESKRCIITAPKAGLVIHPSTAKWKDTPDFDVGSTVHSDQVLLLMPDLTKMQVKVGIHESMVERIKVGMKARVTLPDRKLEGEVTFVAPSAQPSGWWTGNVVKYDTIVELPSVDGLKPGMSAAVEFIMEQHENQTLVPLQAVVRTDAGAYCWVGNTQKHQKRELQLGDNNDEFYIVESGLSEGETVLLDPGTIVPEARQMMFEHNHASKSK